ncbi:MAG: hypothetical protein MJY82_06265 [Fibrobacter sp.]|nr:hypothetical protein [Fibrobacter sp.]
MRKIFFIILFLSVSSFALTLNQVRADLKNASVSGDSVEMKIRTTVNTTSGKQVVSVYVVQKSKSKMYSEIKTSFMNQRTVVNGNRMKVIDLNTNKVQLLPYNGEALEALSYTRFNPLDSGDWKEPMFVSENLYSIEGPKGILYYDAKKKRIEKMESTDEKKSVLTTFAYDGEGKFKSMNVVVNANGVETSVFTEILLLRSSEKFPDRLFEF